jgi:hypothetical protein
MNKKADQKYSPLISIILGLILIVLVFGWLFQETLFGEEEITFEKCKQSILARHLLPEAEVAKLKISLKNQYPLQCKTQIIEINKDNKDNAKEIIGDALE